MILPSNQNLDHTYIKKRFLKFVFSKNNIIMMFFLKSFITCAHTLQKILMIIVFLEKTISKKTIFYISVIKILISG